MQNKMETEEAWGELVKASVFLSLVTAQPHRGTFSFFSACVYLVAPPVG